MVVWWYLHSNMQGIYACITGLTISHYKRYFHLWQRLRLTVERHLGHCGGEQRKTPTQPDQEEGSYKTHGVSLVGGNMIYADVHFIVIGLLLSENVHCSQGIPLTP